MRRVLATFAYWAVGLIVYPVRIGADWVETHHRKATLAYIDKTRPSSKSGTGRTTKGDA